MGIWSEKTNPTTGNYPSISGMSVNAYSDNFFSDYYGITSGAAKDNKYGTSLRVYQAYNENGANRYGGSQLVFNTQPANSVYLGISVNVESTENDTYITRGIYFDGANSERFYPFTFSGSGLSLAGTEIKNADGTIYQYQKDKWYDFKIWMNTLLMLKHGQPKIT